MNSSRRVELQASLQHELNRQSRQHNLSRTGRVVWLLDQVENYVERWAGRGTKPKTAGSVSDDLFHMIEIGVEAVSTELHRLGPPVIAESWNNFVEELSNVRAGNERIEAKQLANLLAAFRSEFRLKQAPQDVTSPPPETAE